MTTKSTKSDRNLLKLKVALAAGGLVTTLIGAGMLGSQAGAAAAEAAPAPSAAAPAAAGPSRIETSIPASLDLNLEAVPTVAAPAVRQMAVAHGRSSG
mgnify:CR=1 FL=1